MKAIKDLDIIIEKHGISPFEWQNLLNELKQDQKK